MVTGRYWANVSDTLLTGEFRQWEEGKLTVNVHKPGKKFNSGTSMDDFKY